MRVGGTGLLIPYHPASRSSLEPISPRIEAFMWPGQRQWEPISVKSSCYDQFVEQTGLTTLSKHSFVFISSVPFKLYSGLAVFTRIKILVALWIFCFLLCIIYVPTITIVTYSIIFGVQNMQSHDREDSTRPSAQYPPLPAREGECSLSALLSPAYLLHTSLPEHLPGPSFPEILRHKENTRRP